MSSDDENYGRVCPAAHKKLMSEINEIVKFQHIKKPLRSEPTLKNSEFHLVKSKSSNEDCELNEKNAKKSVSISHIAHTVQKNTKQKQIGKQLKNAFKNENVLAKPLEKVYAERIKRTIAYDNTKAKLGRWDAVVTKNQNATQIKFPLSLDRTTIDENKSDVRAFRYQTKMMKEVEEIHNEFFPKLIVDPEIGGHPEILSLEEMKEQRKELGRLKLKESHKIAKKRLQGKIKSKKYHKLKKREDLKSKIKEFEELKIKNPELALKELAKIEQQRIKERTTLRHKNTGTWAKNLQVRAKYDDNVKRDLETQLSLGRELLQKNRQSESSDSEDEELPVLTNSENTWLGSIKESDPLDEVFSGYKKFWEEHNVNIQKQLKKVKKDSKVPVPLNEPLQLEDSIIDEVEAESSRYDDENPSKYINDLFDEAEEKINSKMENLLTHLKPNFLNEKNVIKRKNPKKKVSANARDANFLGFEKKVKLGDVDNPLIEGKDGEIETTHIPSKFLLREIKKKKEKKINFMKGNDINPESFLSVKSKHLIIAVPKLQEKEEADNENEVNRLWRNNKLSLAEAFENDDIVNDFELEVEHEEQKNSLSETTLLPGWGNWGGKGIKEKNTKFFKKDPKMKKKDRIIINCAPNEKLQKHLISSVPFPFKSLQDFEASMRLPIGRDFIPETAHRKLTMPAIVTKAGTIIEPMSENVLVDKSSIKNVFSKRNVKKGRKVKK